MTAGERLHGPRISVVIATYNRAGLLEDCLRALLAEPLAAGDEIIVADNGSTDATQGVIARHRATAPDVLRTVFEPTPGKSAALRTALHAARGEIIALTDDDVRVGPGWLAGIRTIMADPSVVLAGGPVAPRWERAAPGWLRVGTGPYTRLAAPIALLHYGADLTDLGARTLLGANMAIRRDALTALGGFAAHLGKLRHTLLSGEDADLCERVRARGWRGVYTAAIPVQHWVPADRMRIGYYLAWFYWSGITHATLEESAAGAGRTVARLPAWLGRRLLSAAGRSLRALVRLDGSRLVDGAIDVAFVCGYAVRRWRLGPARPADQTARRSAA